MADSKTTALTALTTFTGDELFYVVEDDDGTPVSRKVTVEDLATGLAAQSAFAAVAKVPSFHYAVGDRSGNYTTTGSSYGDIAALLALSVPAAAGDRLEISLAAIAFHSSATASLRFTSAIAGTDLATGGVLEIAVPVANEEFIVAYKMVYVVQSGDISGGNVTVKPRWRTSASTATLSNESTLGRAPVFSVTNWKQ